VKNPFPYRHIHLDFHTSPLIPEVGADFDPDDFASTLLEAGVNSICLFAKCHHGLSYYPTAVGIPHPHLQCDLLGEQIEACQRHGINANVYTTVVWDEAAAEMHPEWRQVDKQGRLVGRGPLDPGTGSDWHWRFLCMNTGYADYFLAQTEEIVQRYPGIGGLFVDIVWQEPPGCLCSTCLRSMQEKGLNPASDADLKKHSRQIEHAFMERVSRRVWELHPGLPIFYNSRQRVTADPDDGNPPELKWQSHIEIESLPGGPWGYNHYPLFVRYFQTQHIPHTGMTGRFHKSWADFGGLKPRAALEYECFRMLAGGSGVSVGDQLHPRGRLDKGSYQRIGEVFRQIAEVEPWCIDAVPLADIGVLLVGKIAYDQREADLTVEEGAMRMLLELQQQFQFIDRNADFGGYRLLIVPDEAEVDASLRAKLDDFVAAGGSLLVTGRSGLSADCPTWESLGIVWEGPRPYQPEFLHLDAAVAPDAPPLDYVVYERGERVRALPGTEVLARIGEPYFNRTPFTYTSHQHSPVARFSDSPAITRRGNAIYCAFPLFRAYRRHGNQIYKQVIAGLIRMLLPDPLLKTSVPSTAEISLLCQQADDEDRLLVHLLHYIPQRRAIGLDIVEDIIPLYEVPVSVKMVSQPQKVYLVPQGTQLAIEWDGEYASFVVPRVEGHQIVCIAQSLNVR